MLVLAYGEKSAANVTYIWVKDLFVVERAAPTRQQQHGRSHVAVLSLPLCWVGRARLKRRLVVLVGLTASHFAGEPWWRSAMMTPHGEVEAG